MVVVCIRLLWPTQHHRRHVRYGCQVARARGRLPTTSVPPAPRRLIDLTPPLSRFGEACYVGIAYWSELNRV